MKLPSFLQRLKELDSAVALIDAAAGATMTYADLHKRVQTMAEHLRSQERALVLLFVKNDAEGIIHYLAALEAGHATFLSSLGGQTSEAAEIVSVYRPEIVISPDIDTPDLLDEHYVRLEVTSSYSIFFRKVRQDVSPHPALALLLSTSASSGKSKAVRLSTAGVSAAALQVTAALGLRDSSRALISLPFSYVYGLSVVHSTLCAGGSLVVNSGSVADPMYWSRVNAAGVTTIAGVSETFQLMRRLQITARSLTRLEQLTHSGTALEPGLLHWIQASFVASGVRLYLMYGQTEAGGRISVLDPGALLDRPRSVGKAVEGGEISVGETGEICYRGPGVMMGYATTRADLTLGDVQGGVLATGDIGHLDESGYLYLTGRKSRYAKLFGRRLHLDEVEAWLAADGLNAAALDSAGILNVFIETMTAIPTMLVSRLAVQFRLPPQHISVHSLDTLPRTPRGKICYASLRLRTQI